MLSLAAMFSDLSHSNVHFAAKDDRENVLDCLTVFQDIEFVPKQAPYYGIYHSNKDNVFRIHLG